jgi:hypothetical protein
LLVLIVSEAIASPPMRCILDSPNGPCPPTLSVSRCRGNAGSTQPRRLRAPTPTSRLVFETGGNGSRASFGPPTVLAAAVPSHWKPSQRRKAARRVGNQPAGDALRSYGTPHLKQQVRRMRVSAIFAAVLVALTALSAPASAKGCLKGAVVGGAAGHFAGHHGVLGAAAGCLVGRHYAHKHARGNPNRSGAY